MNRRLLVLSPLLCLALFACGSTATSPATTDLPPAGSDAPAGRGWIGGEPEWRDASSADGAGGGGGGGGDGDAMPMYSESGVADGDVVSPAVPPGEPAPTTVGASEELRAGSVDDNADFAGYLEYLRRTNELGIAARPFDPTGRMVVTVTGTNGLPVLGASITVSAAGEPVAELRTGATGRAIFLPATYGATQASYRFEAGGAAAEAAPGAEVPLVLTTPGGAAQGMAVDVLFLLDVTGSMGDEIDQLKQTIGEVSAQLEQLPQQPDIRFAMTLFRDEGDTFVTSTFDFVGDVEQFRTALDQVVADGGGDTPEAVDEGFAAGLAEPSWRDPASTVQLMFLVGDAAPHVERQLQQAYPASIHAAAARGVTVNVIAASNTDDPAEHAFRAIAQGTGGRFVFLAYGAGGAALGGSTDIAPTDYEEMSLDALVVRLVAEQLAVLTGTDVATPPTTDPTTPQTDPPGQ